MHRCAEQIPARKAASKVCLQWESPCGVLEEGTGETVERERKGVKKYCASVEETWLQSWRTNGAGCVQSRFQHGVFHSVARIRKNDPEESLIHQNKAAVPANTPG